MDRMESVHQQVILGAAICDKLRDFYFKDIPWVECCQEVAVKYTDLKKLSRKFFIDKTDVEILIEVNKYSTSDIGDALTKDG